jgi:hypothetical protein
MRRVSRDANVVQFYGASLQHAADAVLVMECAPGPRLSVCFQCQIQRLGSAAPAFVSSAPVVIWLNTSEAPAKSDDCTNHEREAGRPNGGAACRVSRRLSRRLPVAGTAPAATCGGC